VKKLFFVFSLIALLAMLPAASYAGLSPPDQCEDAISFATDDVITVSISPMVAEMQTLIVDDPVLYIKHSPVWIPEAVIEEVIFDFFHPPDVIELGGNYSLELIDNPMLLVALRFY
jgi:hypothetical protein